MRPGIGPLIVNRRAGAEPARTGCYMPLAMGITRPAATAASHAASGTGDVACERQHT
jgi:hypothetical protein